VGAVTRNAPLGRCGGLGDGSFLFFPSPLTRPTHGIDTAAHLESLLYLLEKRYREQATRKAHENTTEKTKKHGTHMGGELTPPAPVPRLYHCCQCSHSNEPGAPTRCAQSKTHSGDSSIHQGVKSGLLGIGGSQQSRRLGPLGRCASHRP